MTKPTNKDYLTITENGIKLGSLQTTTYRLQKIENMANVSFLFKDIQALVKKEYGVAPIAMHVLSSETDGEYAKSGIPSREHGKNEWVRFVFANGVTTPWVFCYSYSSASACAANGASGGGLYTLCFADFRSGVFGPHADAIKPVVQVKPKVVGWSGDVTTMEIDFGKQKLQFQINASLILKQPGK